MKAFAAKNINPEAYTLYSYAAMEVIAAGGGRCQVARPQEGRRGHQVRQAVQDRDRRPLAYDKKGDITRLDYVMYTWKKGADGKITYVEQ